MKRITLMAGVRVGLALITLGSLAGCCTPNRCAPFALSVSGEEMSIDLGNGVDMTFVRIPAGSFIMGSSTTNRLDEKPLHRVTFAKPFYMSKYLVTVAQWEQIIGDGRSYSKGTNDPVNNVSWYDGQDLIGVLNHNLPRLKFSLPTEAQYEYACRAGGAGEYCYGNDASKLADYGWYKANSGRRLHPVGQKKPNAWGLYDMHGDIYVWCQDIWQKTYKGAPNDGNARTEGMMDYRVIRGGGWCYDASYLRSARRSFIKPDPHGPLIGLRLAMNYAPPTCNFGPGHSASR